MSCHNFVVIIWKKRKDLAVLIYLYLSKVFRHKRTNVALGHHNNVVILLVITTVWEWPQAKRCLFKWWLQWTHQTEVHSYYLFDSFHSTFKYWVIVQQLNFRSKREEANSNQEHVMTLFFWKSNLKKHCEMNRADTIQLDNFVYVKRLLLACLILIVKLAAYYKILLVSFFGISQPDWRTTMILKVALE